MTLAYSTPSFSEFDPTVIPVQDQIIDDVVTQYDYSLGVHEFLLSGSLGSAKSLVLAHLALLHSMKYPRARGALVRKSMPDLKATIFKKINEHMEGALVEGLTYWINHTTGTITFKNGSEIICRSWSDRAYMKLRSLELSFAVVEEITENDDEDQRGYQELKFRVGRLPHIKENWIGSACNPDSPSHWVYNYFELLKDEGLGSNAPLGAGPLADRTRTKHVYYSTTDDNPFLPQSYRDQMRNDLDPKMYERMGRGRWIEVSSDGIYHQYDRAENYVDRDYDFQNVHPVILTWDFNIGEGKPLSVAVCQYIPSTDTFHVASEVVINGMRTEDSCEELAGRGVLDMPVEFYICGDATGKHKDTRSRRSDYEIIVDFLSNYTTPDGRKLNFQKTVPLSNPPVRDRHNLMNAYLRNAEGRRRMFVYKGAPTVDKALRLTRLLDSGRYIEDDSKPYQHVGTAVGYALNAVKLYKSRSPQRTIQL